MSLIVGSGFIFAISDNDFQFAIVNSSFLFRTTSDFLFPVSGSSFLSAFASSASLTNASPPLSRAITISFIFNCFWDFLLYLLVYFAISHAKNLTSDQVFITQKTLVSTKQEKKKRFLLYIIPIQHINQDE